MKINFLFVWPPQVSTLLKWFPDKRGLATGMALMGFGGGAILGAPLAQVFMDIFQDYPVKGIPHTLCALAAIFFVLMMSGALLYRIPPPNWVPNALPGLPKLRTQTSSYYAFKNIMAIGHVHVVSLIS